MFLGLVGLIPISNPLAVQTITKQYITCESQQTKSEKFALLLLPLTGFGKLVYPLSLERRTPNPVGKILVFSFSRNYYISKKSQAGIDLPQTFKLQPQTKIRVDILSKTL
jgi:hypothetical protein